MDLYDEERHETLLVGLPEEIKTFVIKGTSYKPQNRHQNAEELFQELDMIIDQFHEEKLLELYHPNGKIQDKLATIIS